MKAETMTRELVRDLWNFIENINEDDPECTDRFFALRERVRRFYAEQDGRFGSNAQKRTSPKKTTTLRR